MPVIRTPLFPPHKCSFPVLSLIMIEHELTKVKSKETHRGFRQLKLADLSLTPADSLLPQKLCECALNGFRVGLSLIKVLQVFVPHS